VYATSLFPLFSFDFPHKFIFSFLRIGNQCLYIFEWDTSYACPQSNSIPPSEPKDCMVTDPTSKLRYDLTALSLNRGFLPSFPSLCCSVFESALPLFGTGNWIVDDAEYEYLLNVCADVHDVPACVGHSACQTKPLDGTFVKQLGLSSGRPVIEEGVLKLKLTGGRACHGSTVQRQTTIIFSCGQTDSLGKPRFLEVSLYLSQRAVIITETIMIMETQQQETDDCMYIFAWETSAACPENAVSQLVSLHSFFPLLLPCLYFLAHSRVRCAAQDPVTMKYVDLTSLAKTEGQSNYVGE